MKANQVQESAEWMQDRAGKFTASRASDLMAKTRTGPSASRGNLLALLAVERITGQCVETYQNAAMARGSELEGEARDAYSFETGIAIQECGFVQHPTMPYVGCSPDGLIGDSGLVEIKCPASMQKHLESLRSGAHAQEYRWQLQHQLMVTGRDWVRAISYDPRFPVGLQIAEVLVNRDESAIKELLEEIDKAEIEIAAIVAELTELRKAA